MQADAKAVLESLATAVLLTDHTLKIVYANSAAEQLFSMSRSKLTAYKLTDLLDKGQKSLLESIQLALKPHAQGFNASSIEIIPEPHQSIRTDIYVSHYSGKGRGLIVEFRALDYQQKINQEMARRSQHLAARDLIRSLAHEIKNPLASISIYVQLLQKKIRSYGTEIAEDESIQKSLTVISSEIERLNKTIVNFLMAVRPIKLTAEPLSINAVIRNVADFVCEELRGKKIRLVLELDDTVPAISGDEERLRQVFLNFIKNAQEAIGNGREGTIAIRTKAKDTAVIVQIQDDGPGIAQEDLARIFEPYYTTKADGTGLGLPVAYKIIKEHGGDIQVCSFQGEGSCFSLIFPVIREAKRMIGYDSAPAAENKKQDSGGQP